MKIEQNLRKKNSIVNERERLTKLTAHIINSIYIIYIYIMYIIQSSYIKINKSKMNVSFFVSLIHSNSLSYNNAWMHISHHNNNQ